MPSGTSLIKPSQVPSTVVFQRGSNPGTAPLPWHRGAPAGTGTAWGALTSHHTPGVHATRFVPAEQEANQNILSTNTHKTNTAVTQKGEANFSFLSIQKEFWNPR